MPFTLLVALLPLVASFQGPEISLQGAEATQAVSTPRLVVLLAVDQLIPDQLERLEPHLHGGLGRLVREGVVFRNASLDYVRTETGAGHTTFSTGCLPRSHGVVGNSFFDRCENRSRYCVEDAAATALTSWGLVPTLVHRSPLNLRRPTLGEHMQAANPRSKVVSISGKDRAAIGLGGRSKGAVLWWDKEGSGFQSSDHYFDMLPAFALKWNAGWMQRANGWEWRYGTAPDLRQGERPIAGQGTTFPYLLSASDNPKKLAGLVYQSPLVDRYTLEMGRAALRALDLGTDDAPDLLALSFSGCDVVGHASGPYSHEVTDLLLRLDRGLGELFDELDERVGRGRWIAALTADHGVLPLPEHLSAQGIVAERVLKARVGAFRSDLRVRMKAALGRDVKVNRADGGLTFDRKAFAASGLDLAAATATLVEVTRGLAVKHSWIESAWSYDQIAGFGETATGIEGLLRDSFYPGRLPDVTVLNRPNQLVAGENGTSHGTHHWYDRHVPLVLYGMGRGVRSDAAGSHDAVPTILARLGITPRTPLDGRDLLGD